MGGLNSFLTSPLKAYLQQIQNPPIDIQGSQDPNVWASFSEQSAPRGVLPSAIRNIMPLDRPSINTDRALSGMLNQRNIGTPDQQERDRYNPMNLLNGLNTLGLGLSENFKNNRNEAITQERLNNPYMGLLPEMNGRSDNVRFGYQNYQRGGDTDPLNQLFNELYSELEDTKSAPAKEVESERITTDDVEEFEMEQERAMRKQVGRDIVNSFNPGMSQEEITSEELPMSGSTIDISKGLIDRFKNGIFNIESLGTENPYKANNPNSSAYGKYQFLKGTRNEIRKKHFKDISEKEFENLYINNPNMQEMVMDIYSNELLTKFKNPEKAATAFFLGEGKAEKFKNPTYRPTKNNATVGQYLDKFRKGFYK